MTNNRNRTAGEIRHIFDKNGGNLGETGCVGWMFDRLGYIEISKESVKMDEEEFTLYAIEKGVEDIKIKDDIYELYIQIEELENIRKEILSDGIEIKEASLSMVPQNTVIVSDPDQAKKVIKLLEMLEDHDDVQNLYANVEIPEEVLEALE
jgi:YebC/PmpR family DNA-binding regulatory protein